MTTSDGLRPDLASTNGAGPHDAPFTSVLFVGRDALDAVDGVEPPEFFADLHLDQVLEALTRGRRRYALEPFFFVALHDADAVAYRHEVQRDLERPAVRELVARFAQAMQRMRDQLDQAGELHHPLQQQSWFVDAVATYCEAVESLCRDLTAAGPSSRALRGLGRHVAGYTMSKQFRLLAAEVVQLKQAFGEIRYALQISGARVTVSGYAGEPDYSAQVEATFAKFAQGAPRSYLTTIHDLADMDHVETQVLERVARIYPQPFAQRTDFCERHRDYLDATIARFDREVQFYLGYLDLVQRVRETGLAFCYPRLSGRSKRIAARETFDLALADKLVADGRALVVNDFELDGPERMFVVSGPNNGGKTTFARTFGQVHYLASLGLLVPGRAARLFLADRIFTHFEREEDIETLRGKFEDELVRVHAILERATSSSIVVMNESFGSTSLNDARLVGTAVMQQILDLGALGVYVTFVEEIASLSDATVSMVSQVVPDDPAQRTFKVVRQPADGRAYAWAIAEKYGLSYERLMGRVGA